MRNVRTQEEIALLRAKEDTLVEAIQYETYYDRSLHGVIVLEFEWDSEAPGGLIQTQVVGPLPRSS